VLASFTFQTRTTQDMRLLFCGLLVQDRVNLREQRPLSEGLFQKRSLLHNDTSKRNQIAHVSRHEERTKLGMAFSELFRKFRPALSREFPIGIGVS
jgi:hypothetical protein